MGDGLWLIGTRFKNGILNIKSWSVFFTTKRLAGAIVFTFQQRIH